MKLPEKISRNLNMLGLSIKKHSPEILVVAGIVGVVTSAVMACKASTKVNEVIEKNKRKIELINKCNENPEGLPEEYTKEDGKKALVAAYAHTGLELAKLYGPSVVLGALSITSILAGNNILHKRNVALGAAYTALDSGFKKYRDNVIDRFGEELDKELRYGLKTKEIEEKVIDEKGKETVVKKTVTVADPKSPSGYAIFFDETCTGWTRNAEMNKWFLIQQQNWANEKLKSEGYLFLNDVYEALGAMKTEAGHAVGWIYDKTKGGKDGYVDFKIFDLHDEAKRDFVNGYEHSILLDFNVDGPIWDKIY